MHLELSVSSCQLSRIAKNNFRANGEQTAINGLVEMHLVDRVAANFLPAWLPKWNNILSAGLKRPFFVFYACFLKIYHAPTTSIDAPSSSLSRFPLYSVHPSSSLDCICEESLQALLDPGSSGRSGTAAKPSLNSSWVIFKGAVLSTSIFQRLGYSSSAACISTHLYTTASYSTPHHFNVLMQHWS